jgi:holo-[acyl-carrier protein] synthase
VLVGSGIDILQVARMQRELAREGLGMAAAVFTAAELAASRRKRWPHRHLAACFAAKEALFKALGIGLADGPSWQEVELRDGHGRRELVLSGRLRAAAAAKGVGSVLVDACCGRELAVAAVLLQSNDHQVETGPPVPAP